MKKFIRGFLIGGLSLLLVFALTACGADEVERQQTEQEQELSYTEDSTAIESYLLGRWILESAVAEDRVLETESASIYFHQNGSFSIQPYAASGGTLRGSFVLSANTLTLISTELAHGESSEVEPRNEILTMTVNSTGDRITANDDFTFYRSPYYFFRRDDVFIKSSGFYTEFEYLLKNITNAIYPQPE